MNSPTLSFLKPLVEVRRRDVRLRVRRLHAATVILPRQGADGIVVDASAGDLGATELRLGLEAGDEREPREVLRLEDLIRLPETDAVAGFGETAYLGARAVLILPRALLGLRIVELLVPGGPYVLLGARTGVDDLKLAAYVRLLDGERRAVVLGDDVAGRPVLGGEDLDGRLQDVEHRSTRLFLLALRRNQYSHLEYLLSTQFGARRPLLFFSSLSCAYNKSS